MSGYCKYCDRLTNTVVKKRETHIHEEGKRVYYWVGCQDCWDRLQKIT